MEKRSILASTDTLLWYCSPYLDVGSYTYLFMVKNTWQAISDVQDSLEKTKEALTPDLYLEKTFTITNNFWLSDEGTLPSKSTGTCLFYPSDAADDMQCVHHCEPRFTQQNSI